MKIVVFGLTVSSSWGNGHATLWRGLCRAFAARGHDVVFFEKDVPWYAGARDLIDLPGGGELILYPAWPDILPAARRHVSEADAAIVTSYCDDGIAASDLILESKVRWRIFYDLDTPVTLFRFQQGEEIPWLGPRGYSDFDLVLSYTGGRALTELRTILGATCVAPLYGSVDPAVHRPAPPESHYEAALSYLGTWSKDRDEALRTLFLEPARHMSGHRFVIGGAQYRQDFPWLPNIGFVRHLEPAQHAAFYCSSGLTLNVTRGPMAEMGYCPSGRLFEAAACGVPVLSDSWEGLDNFYTPDSEILVRHSTEGAIDAIRMSSAELRRIGRAARERTLADHTADARVEKFERLLESTALLREKQETANLCGA